MVRHGRKFLLAGVLACAMLSGGCGTSEKDRIYQQAVKDLEQGSYEYALAGFEASIANDTYPAQSYRGAGISRMRQGNYEEAVEDFTRALASEKLSKGLQKDILSYRITAFLKLGRLQEAMADCQQLFMVSSPDADGYFLTGMVALAMDSYTEAYSNFGQAFEADSSYDRAIQIYEAYSERGMEADGTYFLERALEKSAKTDSDYCDRGRVYYYMEDYDNARSELIKASQKGSDESLLLLGMVYLAKGETSSARALFIQYISGTSQSAKGYNGLALCDMKEGNYNSALVNIEQGLPYASTEELQSLLYNEVVIYEKMLDFRTAFQKAAEYLEMFPDDAEMARELTFLRSRVS